MQYVSEAFEAPPLVSSAALPWQGVRVEQYHLEAGELLAHHHTHHLQMLYQVEAPFVLHRPFDAREREVVYHTGDLGLYPGGEHGTIRWNTACDNVFLMVDDQHLERVARQGLDLSLFALHERRRFHDPFLVQLSRQLLVAAGSQHALGLLYVESLTNALCHHLIENHAAFKRAGLTSPRLTATVLARLDAYLEAHAEHPITLEALAGVAHLSVFHFARLFKQTVGMPPYQYVLHWKIKRAQHLLRLAGTSVGAISDALGFASPASFSVAFKRAVGRSPQEFQRG